MPAPSIIQSASDTSISGATIVLNLSQPVVPDDLIYVAIGTIGNSGGDIVAGDITDDQSGSYTLDSSVIPNTGTPSSGFGIYLFSRQISTAASSLQVTLTKPETDGEYCMAVLAVGGQASVSFIDDIDTVNRSDGSSSTFTRVDNLADTTFADDLILGFFLLGEQLILSDGSGFTAEASGGLFASGFMAVSRRVTATGSYDPFVSHGNSSNNAVGIGVSIKGKSATIDQAAFRWRNDDGDETTATWAAAENTNLSNGVLSANKRLRLLLDLDGNPDDLDVSLEFDRSTDGGSNWDGWAGMIPTSESAPTQNSGGTRAYSTGAVNVQWPASGYAVGDVGFLWVETSGQNITVPSGWTQVTGSPVNGPGDYTTQLNVLWRRVDTVPMPSASIPDPGDHILARIIVFGGVISTDPPFEASIGTGASTGADQAVAFPSITTTVDNTRILHFLAIDDDINGSSWANANLGSITAYQQDTIAGNDGAVIVVQGVKDTAGATGQTTGNLDLGGRQAMLVLALKPARPAVYIRGSANIGAGQIPTTAQLTAPAGKTNNYYQAGVITDDTELLDYDGNNDRYSEFEWSIRAASDTALNTLFRFRAVADGSPLDTYTQTPQWTIVAAPVIEMTFKGHAFGFGRSVLAKVTPLSFKGHAFGFGKTGTIFRRQTSTGQQNVVMRTFGVRVSDNAASMANPTELRCSAISLTKRISTPDVAQITIPNARYWAGILTPLVDNLVEIYRINTRADGSTFEEQMTKRMLVNLIDTNYGARSSSITLNCEADTAYVGDTIWIGEALSSLPTQSGKARPRIRIIPAAKPGDTIDLGDLGSVVARFITYVISPGAGSVWMEVGE